MSLLRRRPLTAFFALAYLGSWIIWIPVVLTRAGIGIIPVDVPLGLQSLLNTIALFTGPFLAALVMTLAVDGSTRPFWRQFGWRRPRGTAWLVALVGVPTVIVVLGLLRPTAATEPPAGLPQDVPLGALAAVIFVLYLVGGPLQEEPGWRGFALPRLERAMHPMAAAGILGVLWALWHLPQFWLTAWDTPHETLGDFAVYVLFVVALSVVMSWVWHLSRGSILPVVLGHNAVNWSLGFVPPLLGRAAVSLWWAALGFGALALVAAVLTRGRLAPSDHRPGPNLAEINTDQ